MLAVQMYVDTLRLLACHVTAQVVFAFYHQTLLTLLSGQIGKGGTEQTGTYNEIIVWFEKYRSIGFCNIDISYSITRVSFLLLK